MDMATYYRFIAFERESEGLFFREFEIQANVSLRSFGLYILYMFGTDPDGSFYPVIFVGETLYGDQQCFKKQINDYRAFKLSDIDFEKEKSIAICDPEEKYVYVCSLVDKVNHRGNQYAYIRSGQGASIFPGEYGLYKKMLNKKMVSPKIQIPLCENRFDLSTWARAFDIELYARDFDQFSFKNGVDSFEDFMDAIAAIEQEDLIILTDNEDLDDIYIHDHETRIALAKELRKKLGTSNDHPLDVIQKFYKKHPCFYRARLDECYFSEDPHLGLDNLLRIKDEYLEDNEIPDQDLMRRDFLLSELGYQYLNILIYITCMRLNLDEQDEVIYDLEPIVPTLKEMEIGRFVLLPLLSGAYLLKGEYDKAKAINADLEFNIYQFDDVYIAIKENRYDDAIRLLDSLKGVCPIIEDAYRFTAFLGLHRRCPEFLIDMDDDIAGLLVMLYFMRFGDGIEGEFMDFAAYATSDELDELGVSYEDRCLFYGLLVMNQIEDKLKLDIASIQEGYKTAIEECPDVAMLIKEAPSLQQIQDFLTRMVKINLIMKNKENFFISPLATKYLVCFYAFADNEGKRIQHLDQRA